MNITRTNPFASKNEPKSSSCSCNTTILKITLIVFGLLLIGGAITSYIYQVNSIAVYTLGGTGGFIILTISILSIAQCISHRRSEKNESPRQPQSSIHDEESPARRKQDKDIPSSMVLYQQPPTRVSDIDETKPQQNFVPTSFYRTIPPTPNASPDKCETNQIQTQAPDGSLLKQYEETKQWIGPNEYHVRTNMAQEIYVPSKGEKRQTVSQQQGFCNNQVAVCEEKKVEEYEWDGSQGIRGAGVSYTYSLEVRAVNPSIFETLKKRLGWSKQ